jgi:hypothetical protein
MPSNHPYIDDQASDSTPGTQIPPQLSNHSTTSNVPTALPNSTPMISPTCAAPQLNISHSYPKNMPTDTPESTSNPSPTYIFQGRPVTMNIPPGNHQPMPQNTQVPWVPIPSQHASTAFSTPQGQSHPSTMHSTTIPHSDCTSHYERPYLTRARPSLVATTKETVFDDVLLMNHIL